MVESIQSMPARTPLRDRHPAPRPAVLKPRLPHPHLAPLPKKESGSVGEKPATASAAPAAETSWSTAAVPMARPAGRTRIRSNRQTPAERTLSNALRFGLFVNAAALVTSRLDAVRSVLPWSYGGEELLLASVVLLSGYALLILGRRSADQER
jgi:hypothetical protein